MNKKVEMGKQYKSSAPDGLFHGVAFRRVLGIDCTGNYPVAIEIENGEVLKFTEDGYFSVSKGNSVWDLIEVSPYADFKTDDRVMVSDDRAKWSKRYFYKEIDGAAWCFDNGVTSWTWTHQYYGASKWKYCRRPTEEELKEKRDESVL